MKPEQKLAPHPIINAARQGASEFMNVLSRGMPDSVPIVEPQATLNSQLPTGGLLSGFQMPKVTEATLGIVDNAIDKLRNMNSPSQEKELQK